MKFEDCKQNIYYQEINATNLIGGGVEGGWNYTPYHSNELSFLIKLMSARIKTQNLDE